MTIEAMYQSLGVSPEVYAYGERVLKTLEGRFREIDEAAEYNQCKVLAAMHKNRVKAAHFAATTGYGYNDDGRDTLERVYADCFHTEAALVRPQITCGTHALTVALSANLLPGDELLSPVGAPYFSRIRRSSEPPLTPMRMGRPAARQASATSLTFHRSPMLPGLMRILSAPPRTAAMARR